MREIAHPLLLYNHVTKHNIVAGQKYFFFDFWHFVSILGQKYRFFAHFLPKNAFSKTTMSPHFFFIVSGAISFILSLFPLLFLSPSLLSPFPFQNKEMGIEKRRKKNWKFPLSFPFSKNEKKKGFD